MFLSIFLPYPQYINTILINIFFTHYSLLRINILQLCALYANYIYFNIHWFKLSAYYITCFTVPWNHLNLMTISISQLRNLYIFYSTPLWMEKRMKFVDSPVSLIQTAVWLQLTLNCAACSAGWCLCTMLTQRQEGGVWQMQQHYKCIALLGSTEWLRGLRICLGTNKATPLPSFQEKHFLLQYLTILADSPLSCGFHP